MTITRRAALGGAFSLAAFTAASAKPATSIRIGHQCDLTGALAHGGYWRKKAVDAAVNRLNLSGGVVGRRVEVVTVDTATDIDVGIARLKNLLDDQRVDFVIGSQHDEIARRSSALMHDRTKIYISMSRADEMREDAPSATTFRLAPNARSTTRVAKPVLGMPGNRWVVIHSDDAWGRTNRDVWAEQAAESSAEVVQSIAIAPDANVLHAIAPMKADSSGVFLALLGPELPKAFLSLVQLGHAEKPIVAADTVLGAVDIQSYGSRARNVWGIETLPWRLSDKDTPAMRTLRAAVGIDPLGREVDTGRHAAVSDIWAAWESVSFIKVNAEGVNWRTAEDTIAAIRHAEANAHYAESDLFPQGKLYVRPQDHRAFCDAYLMRVAKEAVTVRGATSITEGIYPALINIASN